MHNHCWFLCSWQKFVIAKTLLFVLLFFLLLGPCTAWNLTIHEYSKNGDPAGLRLHTFCSRNIHKNFTLPWKTNTVVVRWVPSIFVPFDGPISRKFAETSSIDADITTVTRHFLHRDYDAAAWIIGAIYIGARAQFLRRCNGNLKIDCPERFIQRRWGIVSKPDKSHGDYICHGLCIDTTFPERGKPRMEFFDVSRASLVKDRFVFIFSRMKNRVLAWSWWRVRNSDAFQRIRLRERIGKIVRSAVLLLFVSCVFWFVFVLDTNISLYIQGRIIYKCQKKITLTSRYIFSILQLYIKCLEIPEKNNV